MDRRIGTYVTHAFQGESYRSYIPVSLPPAPPIDMAEIYPYLEKATLAVAALNGIHTSINVTLFIYMYVRKEALLSSQIEGTQSSFSDLLLFEYNQKPKVSLEDVEEVSNYVKAVTYALQRLKGGFPLSLRLLREIHEVLLSGARGTFKSPGEFRKSQNWIGGTKPSNALFVPPSVEHLDQCLSDFERFLHDDSMPVLIKAGLAHVQFETIHPFLDGNGRLGRLLIVLLLIEGGMIDEPIIYISLYLKQHRTTYYDLLQEVRTHGRWEVWLEFFLKGVAESAQQALEAARAISALFVKDAARIVDLGRARFSSEQVFEYLKKLPQVTVSLIASSLSMALPTARSAINNLVKLGILEEISGKKRERVYVYREYVKLLEQGAEPF